MTKVKGNKSQAIRDLLKTNRKMPTSEIISTLAEQGIKVEAGLIYMVKGKLRAKRRKQVRRKVAGITGNGDAVALIRSVKDLAADAGGLGKLKQLVEAIAE